MSSKATSFRFTRCSFRAKLWATLGITAVPLLALLNLPSATAAQANCCVGTVGDANGDGSPEPSLGDITLIIDAKFISLSCDAIPCIAEADINQSGGANPTCEDISIVDVTILIDYLFITGPENITLPQCDETGLTFSQREAVFNAIDSAYNSLLGEPDDSAAIKLAAYLNTIPDIDSAGVIDSVSVWAWFTDGRIISVPNNRFPSGSASNNESWVDSELETSVPIGFEIPDRRFPDLVDPLAEDVLPRVAAPAYDYDLPSSIQARVVSTLGTGCFAIGAPIIKSLLENHGYVTVPSTGSVTSLFSVVDDGIYYIDAHGGGCMGRDGARHLAVWTATTVGASADSAYRTQLNRNELVYMQAMDRDPSSGTCRSHRRYAYTGRFVAQYMYFVPNSYIFINACYS
ncbi:MAG: hypothetical protein AB1772_10985, partial [Candidatus Zixiibacteriota bacterium]